MADPIAHALSTAHAALERDDEQAVLDALLFGWRATHSPVLASAIDAVTARLKPHLPPIEGPLEQFQPRWLAIATQRRSVDLPRLLESILEGTSRFGKAVVEALIARGQAVRTWPDDPRSGTLLLGHLTDGGYESKSGSTLPFWSALLDLLVAHGDRRLIGPMSKVRYQHIYRHFSDGKRRIAWFQTQLDTARAALEEKPKPVSSKASATALLAALKKRPVTDASVAFEPAPNAKAVAKKPSVQSGTVQDHLAQAAKALNSGDDARALEALLSVWRLTRSAAIAEAAEEVSARLAQQRVPLSRPGEKREVIHARWLAVAQENDSADLPRLLESLTDTYFRSTDARDRLTAIANRPPDPRATARALHHMSDRLAFHASSTKPFWSELITFIADQADPRAGTLLVRLAARFHRVLPSDASMVSWFRKQLTAAAASIPAAATELSVEALAPIIENLGGPDAQFFENIAARPADRTLRQLLADQLLERGDPRGEFIALQLAHRDEERTRALQSQHAQAWVGPLLPFIDLPKCTFEGGFLSTVVLRPKSLVGFAQHIGAPIWATVKRVEFERLNPTIKKLMAHPIMKSLESKSR